MAIKKYGEKQFSVELVEEAESAEELNEKEQNWIKKLNTIAPIGYNLNEGGKVIRPILGPSPETREKMRKAKMGVPRSQKTRDKIRAALIGKPQAAEVSEKRLKAVREAWANRGDELRKKISKLNKGRKRSKEVIDRMSAARKGIPMKEEHKAKRRGRKATQETKMKMREALLGRKQTPEAIEKSRVARTGKKRSEESKEKMRLAHQRRKQNTQ